MRSENRNHLVTGSERHVVVLLLTALTCALSYGCKARPEPTLGEKLTDTNPIVRQASRQDIRSEGVKAVPSLLATYAKGNEEQRQAALESLGDVGLTSTVAADKTARALAGIIMDAPDPKTKHLALLQIKRIGKAALPALADIVVRTRGSFMDPADTPRTIDVLAAMLDIGRAESTVQLIKMLSASDYSGYQAKVDELLQVVTKRDFDFQHAASAVEKAEVVRKWQQWWQREGQEEMGK